MSKVDKNFQAVVAEMTDSQIEAGLKSQRQVVENLNAQIAYMARELRNRHKRVKVRK